MEKFPTRKDKFEFNSDHFASEMKLLEQSNGTYFLDENYFRKQNESKELLEEFPLIESDKVLRPDGDTTIFTTAGIQHFETLERGGDVLEGQKFTIAQPVVRSQFMDRIKEGYSTAFINETIAHFGSSAEDFMNLCKQMIFKSLDRDSIFRKYHLTIETCDDRWGDKKFTKEVVTLYYNNDEVSEGVFMDKFPKKDGQFITVSEISWGRERLNWIYRKKQYQPYFTGFEEFYKTENKDEIARVIDPIRTATLMFMQGIIPSHKDPGFRLRQLIKRFFEHNSQFSFSEDRLLELSCDFWVENHVQAIKGKKEILDLLRKEMMRAQNVYIVGCIKKEVGKEIKVDVNLSTDEFIKRIYSSPSQDITEIVKNINIKNYDA